MNWRAHRRRLSAWFQNKLHEYRYFRLTEEQLRGSRKSDTVFIFGSGYSLNNIAPEEYRKMEAHDTLGFNWFVHQSFLRIDYHMIREIYPDLPDRNAIIAKINEYGRVLCANNYFDDTIFLIQKGYVAIAGNCIIGMKLLPDRARVFRFYTCARGGNARMSQSLSTGLAHGSGSLMDCLNFAYLMQWRNVVLVGIDLYDRRYFWQAPDETRYSDKMRGKTYKDRHNTADNVIKHVADWYPEFSSKNFNVSVYNPKSLLTEVLPVFSWECLENR